MNLMQIPVAKAWIFYPDLRAARNIHNGAIAWFHETVEGWQISVTNCPARWMFDELCEWFADFLKVGKS